METRRGATGWTLERVYEFFPRTQVHVIDSADYFSQPAPEYQRLLAFLGLRPFEPGLRIDAISRSNAGRAARTGWKRASTKPSRCISSLSASSSSNAVPTPRCLPYSAAATTARAR